MVGRIIIRPCILWVDCGWANYHSPLVLPVFRVISDVVRDIDVRAFISDDMIVIVSLPYFIVERYYFISGV